MYFLPGLTTGKTIQVQLNNTKKVTCGLQSLTATGRHLPYGITHCYLPPDTSERTPP